MMRHTKVPSFAPQCGSKNVACSAVCYSPALVDSSSPATKKDILLNAAFAAAQKKVPLAILLVWSAELTALHIERQLYGTGRAHSRATSWQRPADADAQQQLLKQLFSSREWASICHLTKTPVVLLLSGCSPRQLVHPAQQELVRQLQDCVLQLLPEGSTAVPLSRSGELDQEWLRTLTRQGEAEGAEHGQKVVQKLIAYLPDIRGRQLIAGGSAQVWALEKTNDRVLHKLSSGRHAQMAATVEQLQQQQRLLQEKLAAIRHTQVTEPAAGCLAAEALSSNHTAQAVSAAIQELLSQQDVKRLEDWRQLKQLLDRAEILAADLLSRHFSDKKGDWTYGISAASHAAVHTALAWLDSRPLDVLKQLAHLLNYLPGEGGSHVYVGDCDDGLDISSLQVDQAAAHRAQLKQAMLLISGSHEFMLDEKLESNSFPERPMLQAIFWLLFCLHALLTVGPTRSPEEPLPDMKHEETRICAYAQHIPAEQVIDRFICQVVYGRGVQLRIIRGMARSAAKQQTTTDGTAAGPQHQQKMVTETTAAAAAAVTLPASARPQSAVVSPEPPMLGDYCDEVAWLQGAVNSSLEGVDHLAPLHHLLWKHTAKFLGLGFPPLPAVLDFNTAFQQAHPSVLGRLLRNQSTREREEKWRKAQQLIDAAAAATDENEPGTADAGEVPPRPSTKPGTAPSTAAEGTGQPVACDGGVQAADHGDGVNASQCGGRPSRAPEPIACSEQPQRGPLLLKRPRSVLHEKLKHFRGGVYKLKPELAPAEKFKRHPERITRDAQHQTSGHCALLDDADSRQQPKSSSARGKLPSVAARGTGGVATDVECAALAGARQPNPFRRVKIVSPKSRHDEVGQIKQHHVVQPDAAAAAAAAATTFDSLDQEVARLLGREQGTGGTSATATPGIVPPWEVLMPQPPTFCRGTSPAAAGVGCKQPVHGRTLTKKAGDAARALTLKRASQGQLKQQHQQWQVGQVEANSQGLLLPALSTRSFLAVPTAAHAGAQRASGGVSKDAGGHQHQPFHFQFAATPAAQALPCAAAAGAVRGGARLPAAASSAHPCRLPASTPVTAPSSGESGGAGQAAKDCSGGLHTAVTAETAAQRHPQQTVQAHQSRQLLGQCGDDGQHPLWQQQQQQLSFDDCDMVPASPIGSDNEGDCPCTETGHDAMRGTALQMTIHRSVSTDVYFAAAVADAPQEQPSTYVPCRRDVAVAAAPAAAADAAAAGHRTAGGSCQPVQHHSWCIRPSHRGTAHMEHPDESHHRAAANIAAGAKAVDALRAACADVLPDMALAVSSTAAAMSSHCSLAAATAQTPACLLQGAAAYGTEQQLQQQQQEDERAHVATSRCAVNKQPWAPDPCGRSSTASVKVCCPPAAAVSKPAIPRADMKAINRLLQSLFD